MSVSTRALRHADPFQAAQREFDVVFGRLLNNGCSTPASATNGGSTVVAPFPVDVRQVGDNIVFEAELPGFNKDQLSITFENGVLTIAAERGEATAAATSATTAQATTPATDGTATEATAPVATPAPAVAYLLKERRYNRFQRSFTLPPTIDDNNVTARLDAGVLTVTLTKREEAKPRKITVA